MCSENTCDSHRSSPHRITHRSRDANALSHRGPDAKETVPEDSIACIVKYLDESNKACDPSCEYVDFVFCDPLFAETLTCDAPLNSVGDVMISDHVPPVTTFRILLPKA